MSDYNQNNDKQEFVPSPTIKEDNSKSASATTGELVGKQSTLAPLVKLNGYTFSESELNYIEIETSGFLPTCSLVIEISGSSKTPFFPKYFPKDNDIVSIFMRSENDKLKPFRNDYLIKEVSTTKAVNVTEGVTIFIEGVLFVKNLFSDTCLSVPDATSIEALVGISDTLDLGFVTNETIETMNDKMTWISPQTTFYEFIKHVTNSAYKDEFSFFDCWIDIYYNLNFINLHKIYDSKETDYIDDISTEYKLNTYTDDIPGITKGGNSIKVKVPTFLTNDDTHKEVEGFFHTFSLENKSSKLNIVNGKGRNVMFYDKNLRSNVNLFVEQSLTDGLEYDKKWTKLENDNYKDSYKVKWGGIQYSRPNLNVHNYYKIAPIQNYQNINGVSKLMLCLKMVNSNWSIYKGMKVPVMIKYRAGSPEQTNKIKANTSFLEDEKGNKVPTLLDEFFSGSYVIDSIIYKFTKEVERDSPGQGTTEFGQYHQEVKLTRREWGKYSIDLDTKEGFDSIYPKEDVERIDKASAYSTPKKNKTQ